MKTSIRYPHVEGDVGDGRPDPGQEGQPAHRRHQIPNWR